MTEATDWLSASGDRLMLIYGDLDPWTAGALELDRGREHLHGPSALDRRRVRPPGARSATPPRAAAAALRTGASFLGRPAQVGRRSRPARDFTI